MSDDDLNPYAPPRRAAEEDRSPFRRRSAPEPRARTNAWFEDGRVVAPRIGAELPERCVVCSRPTSFKLKRDLAWLHPAYSLLILAGWILYIIVFMVARKTATLYVGLCDEHERRRKNGLVVLWGGVLAAIVTVFLGLSSNAPMLLLFSVVGMLVALIAGGLMSRVITVKKMDEQYVYFTAGAEFMRALPTDPYDADEEPVIVRKKKKKRRPKPAAEEPRTEESTAEESAPEESAAEPKPAGASASSESDDAEKKASSD